MSCKNHKRGFTIVEIMIVTALVGIFIALTVQPLAQTMGMTDREATVLNMNTEANRALNSISSKLRSGFIPIAPSGAGTGIITFPKAGTLEAGAPRFDSSLLKPVLSSAKYGFGGHGADWLKIWEVGTDMLFFTEMVDFHSPTVPGDGDRQDSNNLPELGINVSLSSIETGASIPAATYETYQDSDNIWHNWLGNNNIHPPLSSLSPPADFDIDPNDPARVDRNMQQIRFAQPLNLPAGRDFGYGIYRFLPTLEDGAPIIIEEARLRSSDALGYDLNGNGVRTDEFVVGSLELIYAVGGQHGGYVSQIFLPSSLLLQINTNDTAWEPIFTVQEMRTADGATSGSNSEYVIGVSLLVYDYYGQRNSVSFGNATPNFARRYRTTVQLRNLARR